MGYAQIAAAAAKRAKVVFLGKPQYKVAGREAAVLKGLYRYYVEQAKQLVAAQPVGAAA